MASSTPSITSVVPAFGASFPVLCCWQHNASFFDPSCRLANEQVALRNGRMFLMADRKVTGKKSEKERMYNIGDSVSTSPKLLLLVQERETKFPVRPYTSRRDAWRR